ncbi:ribonuclease H-like domain-containing protein [Tanacetum coccineum]
MNTTTLHPLPPTLKPTTRTQASKDPQWRKAMDLEFNALIQNQTWEPIGCFLQQHGKDYFDTFNPVTKPNTIRTILSIALSKNWSLCQLDINNAFLHGTLHEDVFMAQPPDSDWGGVNDVGRSTTAYILYLGTNIISWNSTRQKSVSRSSTEAEYKALANASAELCWTKNILHELGIPTNHTPTLFCDNTGATYLYANPVYHSRMKHVALD